MEIRKKYLKKKGRGEMNTKILMILIIRIRRVK